MKLWKKVLLSICMFGVIMFSGIAFLIGTSSGLQVLLKSINYWGINLSIKDINGNWQNLTLNDINYRTTGTNINVKHVHLAVNLTCLLHSSICMNDVFMQNVSIVVDSKKIARSHNKQIIWNSGVNLNSYYPFILNKVRLHNLNIKIDNTIVSVFDITTGIHWQDHILVLSPTRIINLLVELPKEVKTFNKLILFSEKLQSVTQLDKTVSKIFSKPLLPKLNSFQLPLDLVIQSLLVEHLNITSNQNLSIVRLLLKVKTTANHLQFKTFDIEVPQGQMKIRGEVILDDNWPVHLTLRAIFNFGSIKNETININLNGMIYARLRLIVNLLGPVYAQLNATAQPAILGFPLSLKFISPSLHWPLNGPIQYQADQFNYELKGKVTNYVMSLQTILKGKRLLPINVSMDGKGNFRQFRIDKLHLAMLENNIDLIALIAWNKKINWYSKLTFSYINDFKKQHLDWPIKLQGKIVSTGSLDTSSWNLSFPELFLQGSINQNKVSVNGSITGNSFHKWKIPSINIVIGRNFFNVKGIIEKVIKLDINLDAPQLDNVLPSLSGIIKSTFKIRGNLQQPQFLLNIDAADFRWQKLQIRHLALYGNLILNQQIASNLHLCIEQLQKNTLQLNYLRLDVNGNELKHYLKLNVHGVPLSGKIELIGNFDRKTKHWNSIVKNTEINTLIGTWYLIHKMEINYFHYNHTAIIGAHCWHNLDTQLCVPESIKVGHNGYLYLMLNRFNLAMLNPLLNKNIKLDGKINGDIHVNWSANGKLPTGIISLKSNSVKIEQYLQGKLLPVVFNLINLNASMTNNRLKLDWLAHIIKHGYLSGMIQVVDLKNSRQLIGNLEINHLSLAIFQPALTQVEKIEGYLYSKLKIEGNLQQPHLFGQLKLSKINIYSNFIPLDFIAANLNIFFNGTNFTFKGCIQTTQGDMNLNGNASWNQLTNWHLYGIVQGNKIRITVPPVARMDISPYLRFEVTPGTIYLNGKINIPWARIIVQAVPKSTSKISLDEVMLDNNMHPVKPKTSLIPIKSNLIIHVGNDVNVSIFGLRVTLNGDLKVIQNKVGLGLNGQINIPSGRFHAYGQDLIVRKGELQFAGPLDQPYVNLEAIRNPNTTEDSVKVGLRVTGLLDEAKIEVFSNPEMSQQEAFSYLLRGQGLNSSGDSNTLTATLIGFGVTKSGRVVSKIGETFGVSNFALDTSGIGSNQQIQVSGYLFPNLEAKYGIGIFDSLVSLTLRYRLMQNLYLEAVYGRDKALDLLYKFEF